MRPSDQRNAREISSLSPLRIMYRSTHTHDRVDSPGHQLALHNPPPPAVGCASSPALHEFLPLCGVVDLCAKAWLEESGPPPPDPRGETETTFFEGFLFAVEHGLGSPQCDPKFERRKGRVRRVAEKLADLKLPKVVG
mmetsp:Transcript_22417/g.30670  ORF Transcript_22417/g.30670 Transcript_22417/m.30670 type:complete len:138 (-) Transcript_22417:859-1272(-)